jgi:hypothetical protein
MMIIGVSATLGVFLLIASRNPYAHKSLICFAVWSSVFHGAIMGVQALMDTTERGHLVGDAPALILVAIILAVADAADRDTCSVDAAAFMSNGLEQARTRIILKHLRMRT